jgi:hypothetical protein
VLVEVELEHKVDWDHLGWVTVQCFNVVDHYEYLKKKDLRERFMMLVTHCTHQVEEGVPEN